MKFDKRNYEFFFSIHVFIINAIIFLLQNAGQRRTNQKLCYFLPCEGAKFLPLKRTQMSLISFIHWEEAKSVHHIRYLVLFVFYMIKQVAIINMVFKGPTCIICVLLGSQLFHSWIHMKWMLS